VRISVAAQEQRMGVALKPNHKSRYDDSMFTKREAGMGH